MDTPSAYPHLNRPYPQIRSRTLSPRCHGTRTPIAYPLIRAECPPVYAWPAGAVSAPFRVRIRSRGPCLLRGPERRPQHGRRPSRRCQGMASPVAEQRPERSSERPPRLRCVVPGLAAFGQPSHIPAQATSVVAEAGADPAASVAAGPWSPCTRHASACRSRSLYGIHAQATRSPWLLWQPRPVKGKAPLKGAAWVARIAPPPQLTLRRRGQVRRAHTREASLRRVSSRRRGA